ARVLVDERLDLAEDIAEGLGVAQGDPPDVAFIEIGMADGAGLALVHHVKALVPNVTVFAIVAANAIEHGAHAMALGAAGTLLLPLGGDEILSAVSTVKVRLAEKAASVELERAALVYSRAAGWMARVAELSDAPNRAAAAERLIEVVLEATHARGVAVYLSAAEKSSELVRAAATPSVEGAPMYGLEADVFAFAQKQRMLAVPLALRKLKVGQLLLGQSEDGPRSGRAGASLDARSAGARIDGLVKLLATQATSAFALLGDRERAHGAALKDPTSSAYSFAYYVDVAGREIDRARRSGRRFAVATIVQEVDDEGAPPLGPAEMADLLLKAVRDTDVVARVDENEFHLLLPETDGIGAHACRRRVLAKLLGDRGGAAVPAGVLVGVATFPHDGPDLAQLLRVARRRADAMKGSIVHKLPNDLGSLSDVLEIVGWEVDAAAAPTDERDGEGARASASSEVFTPCGVELPTSEIVALTSTVIADALRGGATIVVAANPRGSSLAAAARAAVTDGRDNVTLVVIDPKPGPDEAMEAIAILAEHGAYALVARSEGGV
ncbi:MAG TPA: diguanylate cyclase, partial [Byssovorax sp.]